MGQPRVSGAGPCQKNTHHACTTMQRARRCAGRARRRHSIPALKCRSGARTGRLAARVMARPTGGPRARESLGSPDRKVDVPGGAASCGLSRRGDRSGDDTREDHRAGAEIRRRPPRRQTQGERARPALCSVDTGGSADCVTGDHGFLAGRASSNGRTSDGFESDRGAHLSQFRDGVKRGSSFRGGVERVSGACLFAPRTGIRTSRAGHCFSYAPARGLVPLTVMGDTRRPTGDS